MYIPSEKPSCRWWQFGSHQEISEVLAPRVGHHGRARKNFLHPRILDQHLPVFVENVADVGEPWVVGYWKADSVHFGLANLHQGSFSRNFPDFLESSRDYFWPVAAHDEFLFEDSQVVGEVPRVRADPQETICQ